MKSTKPQASKTIQASTKLQNALPAEGVQQSQQNHAYSMGAISSSQILQLQRTIGNQAVTQLLKSHQTASEVDQLATTDLHTGNQDVVQRAWEVEIDTNRYMYKDSVAEVTWYWEDDETMWYETWDAQSPYAVYAGKEKKGTLAKWYMLAKLPSGLIEEYLTTIAAVVPEKSSLDASLHENYLLYEYMLENTGLNHKSLMEKKPFKDLNWKGQAALKKHYIKHVNPLQESEDEGLEYYYNSFYKVMNPFLRHIGATYKGEEYERILSGKYTQDEAKEMVPVLQDVYKKAKYNSEVDADILKMVIARIRGAKKELAVQHEIAQTGTEQIKEVYRGDNSDLINVLAKDLEFDLADFSNGVIEVNKSWTQYQFVSTTESKTIGAPASTGLLWKISLGSKHTGRSGGLYSSENEMLFPPGTAFQINKIMKKEAYTESAPIADANTLYVVYATQG